MKWLISPTKGVRLTPGDFIYTLPGEPLRLMLFGKPVAWIGLRTAKGTTVGEVAETEDIKMLIHHAIASDTEDDSHTEEIVQENVKYMAEITNDREVGEVIHWVRDYSKKYTDRG